MPRTDYFMAISPLFIVIPTAEVSRFQIILWLLFFFPAANEYFSIFQVPSFREWDI